MFLHKKIAIFLLSFFGLVLFFADSYNILSAQTANSPTSAKEEELKKQLDEIESKEIPKLKSTQADLKSESASISRDISILKTKIKEAQLNIKAKNIRISGLSKDISVKSKDIENLEQKINRGKDSISLLLRKTDQIDASSAVDIMLSDNDLSQFFIDIDSFDSIKKSLKSLLDDVRQTKDTTEKQKELLSARKDQETDARMAIEAEKRSIEKNDSEKNKLLSLNKEKEKAYAEILKERENKAASIRTALFALRDTSPIPFGKALEYANLASSKTGVRPAFLLAILTQESNLGQNVGSCFLADTSTGDGVNVDSKISKSRVMNPIRDIPVFFDIMKDLGRDAMSTRVSCWQPSYKNKKPIGWGGAMGPAQFIPSTWKLLKERIASIVGKLIPNPWDPKDAIIASSIYLGDLGADSKSYSAEIRAACKYYGSGGSSCSYGNQVMARAQNIQETMIDFLQGN
ncbi:MAG: lytic murein transglycosylase [Patescibacteria group bacterium]|nr:lytic murein transglycosylase [Patescibacteria group bacterium]MDE1988533.1 lytic murein transglycosylase [Patescibacteria group bacterium]MDE2218277.1 lytic murein transglycosylase [Patescibacteria group bacterium]